MKRTALALALILALLFSAVAGRQLFDLGKADPFSYYKDYVEEGEVPAPEGTEPITILILSPENYTTYASKNIPLIFNVSLPESIESNWFFHLKLYYEASWQSNITSIDYHHSNVINLTDIPEGSHSLEVVADAKYMGNTTRQEFKTVYSNGGGYYNVLTTYYVSYRLISSSTINFTIDLPPKISILSLENKTYSTSNVTLDFTVNKPNSKVTYSLDGKENLTIAGNTTMTGLSNGVHNVTVYAWDVLGNTGASETLFFKVEAPEPFPITLVIALIASVAVIGLGLLVYFKKRKHKA
jgi:hypothetical protein